MTSYKDRLISASTIEETALLEQSTLWTEKQIIVTPIPALNVALSGSLSGGMIPGIVQIAGDSKKFKSKYAIELAKAFQNTFPEGMVLIYDSEFGTPRPYFDDLDKTRIVHSPIVNLEKLRNDMATQLDTVNPKEGDKLFVIIDSLGNVPSLKELNDALAKKEAADLTRAKVIKSVFRIMGAQLILKEVFVVVVNHSYQSIDPYAAEKEVASGGRGSVYNSNAVWMITAARVKDEKELVGWTFTINIQKSRFVKQDSKIPITVSYEDGINQWSGLLDMAVEGGFVIRPTKQLYALAKVPESTFKRKELEDNADFYNYLLKETEFPKWVEKRYKM